MIPEMASRFNSIQSMFEKSTNMKKQEVHSNIIHSYLNVHGDPQRIRLWYGDIKLFHSNNLKDIFYSWFK